MKFFDTKIFCKIMSKFFLKFFDAKIFEKYKNEIF